MASDRVVPEPRCCAVALPMVDQFLICCGGDLFGKDDFDSNTLLASHHITSTDDEDALHYEDFKMYNDILLFNLVTRSWTRVKHNILSDNLPACIGTTCDYDPLNHKILFFGGKTNQGVLLRSLHCVSFETATTQHRNEGMFTRFIHGLSSAATSSLDAEIEKKLVEQDTCTQLTHFEETEEASHVAHTTTPSETNLLSFE